MYVTESSESLPYTKTQTNSTWIRDLYIRAETRKFLYYISGNLHDTGIGIFSSIWLQRRENKK